MNKELIPQNKEGKGTDFKHTVTLASVEEARNCFQRAYKRMLNPPVWHKLAGSMSASFVLTGEHGDPVDPLAQENDRIRIDIPGPGNAAGKGYDWVHVEMIEDQTDEHATAESIGMKVRACADPKQEKGETAHFFGHEATSTFLVSRNNNEVTASYYGRNETPNADTGNIANNVRNALVAFGAFAGLSELQWNSLIKAFSEPEIGS